MKLLVFEAKSLQHSEWMVGSKFAREYINRVSKHSPHGSGQPASYGVRKPVVYIPWLDAVAVN